MFLHISDPFHLDQLAFETRNFSRFLRIDCQAFENSKFFEILKGKEKEGRNFAFFIKRRKVEILQNLDAKIFPHFSFKISSCGGLIHLDKLSKTLC